MGRFILRIGLFFFINWFMFFQPRCLLIFFRFLEIVNIVSKISEGTLSLRLITPKVRWACNTTCLLIVAMRTILPHISKSVRFRFFLYACVFINRWSISSSGTSATYVATTALPRWKHPWCVWALLILASVTVCHSSWIFCWTIIRLNRCKR